MNETAKKAVDLLLKKGRTIAVAESCTGGLIAKLITDIPATVSKDEKVTVFEAISDLDFIGNGEIVFLMDKLHHILNIALYLLLLRLGVAWAPVF